MSDGPLPGEPGDAETRTVFVHDELGLHARPAARLVRAALRYRSKITLEYDGLAADGKSILDILSLAAGQGAALTLRCSGEDALEAAGELAELFTAGTV